MHTEYTPETKHGRPEKHWVSASFLSSKFNISRSTIYRMAGAGIIPGIRVGSKLGVLRFDEDVVREALEKHSTKRF